MFSSITPNRLGPILLAPPFSKVWHCRQTLATCCPRAGSALASAGSIGSGPAAAPPAGAPAVEGAAPPPAPGGREAGFFGCLGRTIEVAGMAPAIATIIAGRTE